VALAVTRGNSSRVVVRVAAGCSANDTRACYYRTLAIIMMTVPLCAACLFGSLVQALNGFDTYLHSILLLGGGDPNAQNTNGRYDSVSTMAHTCSTTNIFTFRPLGWYTSLWDQTRRV
jgi:hypothetical protein